MIWFIYLISALAAGLLLCGTTQLRLQKLDAEYRYKSTQKELLIKTVEPLMEALAVYNKKVIGKKTEGKYRRKLVISGNPLQVVPVEFVALKQITAMGAFALGVFIFMSFNTTPVVPFALGIGGYYLLDLWLSETIVRRKRAIFNALPFTMDLLTLAVEAGLSFLSAIEQVVEKGQATPLRDEFAKMLQDLRLGLSTRDALAGMAERTDMYEIRSFTTSLIQADKLGAPLGETLRNQAEIRRISRFQHAEKTAQEAPVKILFPLLLFIFPAVFIVLLVPTMLKFMAEGM
ncbi:MAG: type II secretion system F family protein [Deltaproteobacteria bacterium]|nr:type II secretion system F family protein [Deltaproteobacteria bacterium]